jgi:phage FluMu gp28-like protein
MARQVGKDFSSGEEGIRDCYNHVRKGTKTTWLLAAPSERQSLESLEKWKEWTEAYKLAIEDIKVDREATGTERLIKSQTILFQGGSRVIAVPGKPATVRGFSANVVATEFAFFENPDATWRALLPSVTNPLRGGAKKVRIISTPNGQGNKFHALWTSNYGVSGAKWSCHKVTLSDAIAQGLPVDSAELREALSDPEAWAAEYDPLDFLDTSAVLLPYDLILTCESDRASCALPFEYWNARSEYPVDLGIDFGRKKNLTICVASERIADLAIVKEVFEMNKTDTPAQVEALRPRIKKARRVCLDYTGPGVGLGDYLVKEFGEWAPDKHKMGKIELCSFSLALKAEIFPKLRMAFESRQVLVPINRTFREDLHSIYRVITPSGNVTYSAPMTDDGHADRCNALALCIRAGASLTGSIRDAGVIRLFPKAGPRFLPRRLVV